MSTRLVHVTLRGKPLVEIPIADGLSIVHVSTEARTRLLEVWRSSLAGNDVGLRVEAIVDGLPVSFDASSLADVGLPSAEQMILPRSVVSVDGRERRSAATGRRRFLLERAALLDDETQDLRARRDGLAAKLELIVSAVTSAEANEAAADEQLAARQAELNDVLGHLEQVQSTAGPIDASGSVEALRHALEDGGRALAERRAVLSRLEFEMDFDRSTASSRQPQLARVPAESASEVVARRQSLVRDLLAAGVDSSSILQTIHRLLDQIQSRNAPVDPTATALVASWRAANERLTTEQAGTAGAAGQRDGDDDVPSLRQGLATARDVLVDAKAHEHLPGPDEMSGTVNFIEQALQQAFETTDRSGSGAVDPEARRRIDEVRAFRQELRDGPVPLDVSAEAPPRPTSVDPFRAAAIAQAAVDVDQLQRKLHSAERRLATRVAGAEMAVRQVRDQIVAYLGADPGVDVVGRLHRWRVVPAMPRQIFGELLSSIETAEQHVAVARQEFDAASAQHSAGAVQLADLRGGAMRRVVDVESRRREADAARTTVTNLHRELVEITEAVAGADEALRLARLPYSADVGPIEMVRAEIDWATGRHDDFATIPKLSRDEMSRIAAGLDARIEALEGNAPVFFDDSFSELPATATVRLVDWLTVIAETNQVVYVTDDPVVLAWAEHRNVEIVVP